MTGLRISSSVVRIDGSYVLRMTRSRSRVS